MQLTAKNEHELPKQGTRFHIADHK